MLHLVPFELRPLGYPGTPRRSDKCSTAYRRSRPARIGLLAHSLVAINAREPWLVVDKAWCVRSEQNGGQDAWTIGVEEEYQVIDATTRQLQPDAERLLHGAQAALGDDVQPELMRSQIEAATAVCATLADVRAALTQARRTLIDTAAKHGDRLGAAGTHPFSNWRAQQTTPKARYQGLSHHFQRLARELVIFGCHVHVSIPDRAAALAVMNRARIWLTPLLALAANSPFW